MSNFAKVIEKILLNEGGYSFDANDPGGETNFGIAKRSHPDVDIKNLTKDQAVAIYKAEYWDKLHLDNFSNIQFQYKLCDIAVNQGVATAQTFLSKLGAVDSLDAVWMLIEMATRRYANIVLAKPSQLAYLRGWINRVFDTGEELT